MMISKAMLRGLCGCLIALSARAASAEEPDPRFQAPTTVRERHELLVSKAKRPERSTPQTRLAKEEGEPLVAVGRLERFEDGVFWLSLAITPEQEAALIQSGMGKATKAAEVRPGMIFEGRAWVSYDSGMSAEHCPTCDPGLLGPDASLVERRVGQEVTLTLARDGIARTRVVGVH